ncbi:related to RAD57 protein [Cephalotrichum gorgonifer]|uniref:Related to RAD57 protein n=1 Tax=Cephalotrichum gorgonifer TaxID=2041049 RepID=A0AAE8N3G6_9PEZI|nr:related to RAD57 protein [Cephalotrichum gorgonifer]
MTDLPRALPQFPTARFSKILAALDKHGINTTDLLTVDATELERRTNVHALDIKRLSAAVLDSLHRDLGALPSREDAKPPPVGSHAPKKSLVELCDAWSTISTLDTTLDASLGGGVPVGYVTEITGESGTGKTQFLLSLLLAVQLPPPYGLSRPALYISTEAPLSTRRLSQMLSSNPLLKSAEIPPTLDNIISTITPDLESQDHILEFQVPVEVERRNIGLIVIDSVAANYRAEFERGTTPHSRGSNMAVRGNELVRLGAHLRRLAQKYNLAVVVANQVADRFSAPLGPVRPTVHHSLPVSTQESPLAARSRQVFEPEGAAEPTYVPPSSPVEVPAPPALLLDHQQRWFSGWGDDPFADYVLKTPSLGLVWSTQVACRIALFRKPVYEVKNRDDDDGPLGVRTAQAQEEDDERLVPTQTGWERWVKIVFAPHTEASGQGLSDAMRFEVTMGGLKALEEAKG